METTSLPTVWLVTWEHEDGTCFPTAHRTWEGARTSILTHRPDLALEAPLDPPAVGMWEWIAWEGTSITARSTTLGE